MTFKILADKSNKIIDYCNVRSANVSLDKNIRFDSLTVPSMVMS